MTKENSKLYTVADYLGVAIRNWARADIMQNAATMAYYSLLALFPTLLVVANLIPLLPINIEAVLSLLAETLPENIYYLIEPVLIGYLNSGSGGAISIGVIVALWSAGNYVNQLRMVLNDVYNVGDFRGNSFIHRIIAPLFIILIFGLLGVLVLAFVFGEQIIMLLETILPIDFSFLDVFLTLRWPVLFLVLMLVFLVIYLFVPNYRLPLKYVIPGTLFSVVGWLLLSEFFSVYVSNSSADMLTNATFGAFIALMLFLFFSSVVILLGGFVNVVVFEAREGISVREDALNQEENIHDIELDFHKGDHYPSREKYVILRHNLKKLRPND